MERHRQKWAQGSAATEHANRIAGVETRIANDGGHYSYESFLEHYGNVKGQQKWNQAEYGTKQTITHHADNTEGNAESWTTGDATEHAATANPETSSTRPSPNHYHAGNTESNAESWITRDATEHAATQNPETSATPPSPHDAPTELDTPVFPHTNWDNFDINETVLTGALPPPAQPSVRSSGAVAADLSTPPCNTPLVPVHNTPDNTSTAATEHSPSTTPTVTISLRQDEAAALRTAEQARRPRRSLHDLARSALNAIATPTPGWNQQPGHGRYECLDTWFPWQTYVACHHKANEIIGPGITHATCESIHGTRDPNRSGDTRTDFVFYRADGSHCRLHPGTRKANDAKPIFSMARDGPQFITTTK